MSALVFALPKMQHQAILVNFFPWTFKEVLPFFCSTLAWKFRFSLFVKFLALLKVKA